MHLMENLHLNQWIYVFVEMGLCPNNYDYYFIDVNIIKPANKLWNLSHRLIIKPYLKYTCLIMKQWGMYSKTCVKQPIKNRRNKDL